MSAARETTAARWGFPRGAARRLAHAALCTLLVLAGAALGCSGERAALLRGQGYYEDNQYERALSIWRALERQQADLSPADFARYAYLRGMTDYRLGFHADARHWLGLAKVAEQQRPGGLDSTWLPRLDGALAALDREAFGMPTSPADAVQSIDVQSIDAPGAAAPAAPADRGRPPPAPPTLPPPSDQN